MSDLLVVTVMSVIILKDRMTPVKAISVVLCLVGVTMVRTTPFVQPVSEVRVRSTQ